MDGSAELVRLAELLRLGAKTGRQIAGFRSCDAAAILRLALQAEDMAAELDAMVKVGTAASTLAQDIPSKRQH